MASLSQLTDKPAQDFANKIGDLFKSVPHLPKEWVAFLVQYAPILSVIGGVFMLLSALGSGFLGVFGLISVVVSFATAALLFLAYKPLQEKKHDGWMYLFWSNVLGTVETILLILGSNALYGIVFVALSFYMLYEIRPAFQGKVEALKEAVKELKS